jgi:hypothetical protein
MLALQGDDTGFVSAAVYRTLQYVRNNLLVLNTPDIRRALEFINYVSPAHLDEDGHEIAWNNDERNAMEARIWLNARLVANRSASPAVVDQVSEDARSNASTFGATSAEDREFAENFRSNL